MLFKLIARPLFLEIVSFEISNAFQLILLAFMENKIRDFGNPSTDPLRFFNAIRADFTAQLQVHQPQLAEAIAAMANGETPYAICISNTFDPESTLKGGERDTQIADAVGLAFSCLLGDDMGISGTAHGGKKCITQVKARQGPTLATKSQSIHPITFHTEFTHIAPKPDFLVLSCVEGDENVETGFLPNTAVVEEMDPSDLEALKEAHYNDTYCPLYPLAPIIIKDGNGVHTYWHENMSFISVNDDSSKSTLQKTEQTIRNLQDSAHYFTLKCGDVLLMNNGSGIGKIAGGLHCRQGKITNMGRELRRIYVMNSSFHA